MRATDGRRAARSSPAPRAGSARRWRGRSPPTAGPLASTTAPTPTAPRPWSREIAAAGGAAVAARRRRLRRRGDGRRVRRDGGRARPGARAGQQRRHPRRRPRAAARRRGLGRASSTPTSPPPSAPPAARCGRCCAPASGAIVNVASIVGPRANAGQANYAASKAGLIGMTRTVAVEVARRGITVNAVAPGLVETELTDDVNGDALGEIPARRPGTPEEVAACVRFLASPEAELRDRNDADRRRRPERLDKNQRKERRNDNQGRERTGREGDLRRPRRDRRRARRDHARGRVRGARRRLARPRRAGADRRGRVRRRARRRRPEGRQDRRRRRSTWWWRRRR